MIGITINEKRYKAPHDWTEITLAKFIELCDIEIPAKLRALWEALAAGDDKAHAKADEDIGLVELEKTFPTYYGKVIRCLTNVPQTVINMMHTALREMLFNNYLRHYVYSTFAQFPLTLDDGKVTQYAPPERADFKLQGTTYELPRTLKVFGSDVPLGDEPAITFAEASDIEIALRQMATGAANRLPMFLAVYCRPAGESYDEKRTIAREKLFHELPMDIVWSVFFCIYRQLKTYQNSTRQFSVRAAQILQAKYGSLVSGTSDGEA